MNLIKKYKEVAKKEKEYDNAKELERYKDDLITLNDLIKEALENNRTRVFYNNVNSKYVRNSTIHNLGFEPMGIRASFFDINKKGLRKLQRELKKYKLN